jgi:hypothetical protein
VEIHGKTKGDGMATSVKDFVIQGYVYQGGSKILNGFVRLRNTNLPDVITVARIGVMNDGTSNPPVTDGIYDAWWSSLGNPSAPDVARVGDIFEVSVYELDSVADINLPVELLMEPVGTLDAPIIPAFNISAVTQAHIDAGMMIYDVYAAANSLPQAVTIVPEDLENGYNLRFTNNSTVKWVWTIPADNENQPIHFKVEWSKDPSFPSTPGVVGVATTLPTDPTRTLFKYEYNPNVFGAFPSTGVENRTGWRCMLQMNLGSSLSNDGEYYWRVSATDGTTT